MSGEKRLSLEEYNRIQSTCNWGQQTFFEKCQRVYILGLWTIWSLLQQFNTVTVPEGGQREHMTNGGDRVLVKLYLQKLAASPQATVCKKLMY